MQISQRLQDFLTSFCGADEDLNETTRILKSAPRSELARWLEPELRAAIRNQLLTPAEAQQLMSRPFDTPTEVATWLNERHQQWFT